MSLRKDLSCLLETPVFDPETALKAHQYGVDRLELCSAFSEGGLTPGPGIFSYLKSKIDIPIFVMVRPRGGNFVYSNSEIEVMTEEVRNFSSLGADGFVFGVLNKEGTVNKKACSSLIEVADEKPCTFHRAFDVSADLMKSLEDIIDCDFKRILTSGGKNSVEEGLPVLLKLLKAAKDEIIIMPGGGMKPEFVQPLKETGYLKEIHASCKKIERIETTHQNKEVQFSVDGLEQFEKLSIDSEKVQEFREVF